MIENLILVDEQDKPIGTEEKLAAHQQGILHRAFSIYVFNSQGELLLQQRAKDKYHSGLLWTNTCCGHPRVGEKIESAAHRRLQEEFGFDCEMREIPHFRYRVQLDHGLTENEFLHLFISNANPKPNPDPQEIYSWKWMPLKQIISDIHEHPNSYTEWFKLILKDPEKLKQLIP